MTRAVPWLVRLLWTGRLSGESTTLRAPVLGGAPFPSLRTGALMPVGGGAVALPSLGKNEFDQVVVMDRILSGTQASES